MTFQEENKIRKEVRGLRQRIAIVERAWDKQKSKNQRLGKQLQETQKENSELEKENSKIKQENAALKAKLESITNHKDALAGMIFKPNKPDNAANRANNNRNNRKPGGQKGHKGHGRNKPKQIDQEKEVYLTNCPDCGNELDQSKNTYERIVEDIPLPQTIATLYHIQRQWCRCCQKEVRAVPSATLEGFRIGLNLIIWILFHKYRLRVPLAKIQEALKEQYNLKLSQGAIQNILCQLKKRFGKKYQAILKHIRNANIKHADETGWRVQGANNWCWLFADKKAAYYTIEETRGKGVPKTVLGESPKGILVRDDYGSYEHLPMAQQSCWAHLLRKSREAKQRDNASKEVSALHIELKNIFQKLKTIIEKPFNQAERDKAYQYYSKKLTNIQKRKYKHNDSIAIQTRIKNQNTNLLTALKYEGAPLTNNHAERQIRPMVVARKISGGSRSPEGAATHAVNVSIAQTLLLEGKSFFAGMKQLLKPRTKKQKYVSVSEPCCFNSNHLRFNELIDLANINTAKFLELGLISTGKN